MFVFLKEGQSWFSSEVAWVSFQGSFYFGWLTRILREKHIELVYFTLVGLGALVDVSVEITFLVFQALFFNIMLFNSLFKLQTLTIRWYGSLCNTIWGKTYF